MSNFANVDLCRQLVLAGMPPTYYYWKQVPGCANAELGCYKLFDPAGIYLVSEPFIEKINKAERVHAYSVEDIQRFIPDYYLERRNGKFTILCEDAFNLEAVTATKLVDAMAMMLLNAFKARIVDMPKELTQIILNK